MYSFSGIERKEAAICDDVLKTTLWDTLESIFYMETNVDMLWNTMGSGRHNFYYKINNVDLTNSVPNTFLCQQGFLTENFVITKGIVALTGG